MSLTLSDAELHRRATADDAEDLLRSMLARERPPRFASGTEAAAWHAHRVHLAVSLVLLALRKSPEMLTILPLGSVAPVRFNKATKKRGPEAVVPLPEELLSRLQDEDPTKRDLLVLVDIDNQLLREGTSRIIVPGRS